MILFIYKIVTHEEHFLFALCQLLRNLIDITVGALTCFPGVTSLSWRVHAGPLSPYTPGRGTAGWREPLPSISGGPSSSTGGKFRIPSRGLLAFELLRFDEQVTRTRIYFSLLRNLCVIVNLNYLIKCTVPSARDSRFVHEPIHSSYVR